MIAETCDELIDLAGKLPDCGYLDEYRKKCFVLGKRIRVIGNAEEYEANALSVDDSGGLVVRADDGRSITLSNEEVSVRIC